MLTRTLLTLIALLVAAGTWRVARWYWRPHLVLPDAIVLERATDGVHAFLDVRNEVGGWVRIEPKRAVDPGDPNGPKAGIPSHVSARIALDHVLPDEPGSYRLEIAVINGEERRSSYVIEMQAIGPDASP